MNALTQLSTEPTVLSETERVQQQSVEEWLAEYNGTGDINTPELPQIFDTEPKKVINNQSPFIKSLKEAGIVSVRFINNDLLITTDRPITADLDDRIKKNIQRLEVVAEPDAGEILYEYMQYRTFFSNKRPFLVLVFKEIHGGEIVERYFNINLKNKKGKSFPTGINGQFRIVGNIEWPMKGSFIKFWKDMMNELPDNRASHIYRYMNSKLSGVVISCHDRVTHYDGTKFNSWKYEGRLYETS